MPVDTKLGKVVTYCERLPPSRLHDFTILMATKLGRVLISGRSFSRQMLKSSPTSCFKESNNMVVEKNLRAMINLYKN